MMSNNNKININSHNNDELNEGIQLAEQELLSSDLDLQQERVFESLDKNGDGTDKMTENVSPTNDEPHSFQFIPLRMGGNGGTHKPSQGSKALIEHEVSLKDLKRMTTIFYELAFQDPTLDKFIRSHGDPHAARFAKWIHQKLSGSNLWDKDRKSRDLTPKPIAGGRTAVVHDRTSAHAAAWYSPKRPSEEVGRHFKLDECRVWMRLHFWAMRQSGIVEQSPSFADYYVRFIGHFVSVYERTATLFARESFRWSASQKNIDTYLKNGRVMKDVVGKNYSKSIKALPEDELNDDEWPYHQMQ